LFTFYNDFHDKVAGYRQSTVRTTAFAPVRAEPEVLGGSRVVLAERQESSTHAACLICCNEAEYFCIGQSFIMYMTFSFRHVQSPGVL
jgi:hypothetical protein